MVVGDGADRLAVRVEDPYRGAVDEVEGAGRGVPVGAASSTDGRVNPVSWEVLLSVGSMMVRVPSPVPAT